MPFPPDAELTKLRIRADQAARKRSAAESAYSQANFLAEQAQAALLAKCNELGICPGCGDPKWDCICAYQATEKT